MNTSKQKFILKTGLEKKRNTARLEDYRVLTGRHGSLRAACGGRLQVTGEAGLGGRWVSGGRPEREL